MKFLVKALLLCTMLLCAGIAKGQPIRAAGGHVYQLLEDGGSSDMAVDGSSTPVEFEFLVPVNTWVDLAQFNIVLTDVAVTNDKFGALTALTNGVTIEIIDVDTTTVLFDFTATRPIRTNTDFALYAGVSAKLAGGGLVDAVLVEWPLQSSGAVLRVLGGQLIRATVNDNLTGLNTFGILIQGLLR